MLKFILLLGVGAFLTTLPVLAQPRGAYDGPYSRPGYHVGWVATDKVGQPIEKPTSPQEDDSTSSGQNMPLSQRIDPENPTSPSMNGTAD